MTLIRHGDHGRASLTAATVALVASLKWCIGNDKNETLHADLLRNLPWR